MKKIISALVIISVFLLFSFSADARSRGKDHTGQGGSPHMGGSPMGDSGDGGNETTKESAKDCKAIYILKDKETGIDKYSLPDLKLVTSVDFPAGTTATDIGIAGECGDPTETILVHVIKNQAVVLQSFDQNLQSTGELTLEQLPQKDNGNNNDNGSSSGSTN